MPRISPRCAVSDTSCNLPGRLICSAVENSLAAVRAVIVSPVVASFQSPSDHGLPDVLIVILCLVKAADDVTVPQDSQPVAGRLDLVGSCEIKITARPLSAMRRMRSQMMSRPRWDSAVVVSSTTMTLPAPPADPCNLYQLAVLQIQRPGYRVRTDVRGADIVQRRLCRPPQRAPVDEPASPLAGKPRCVAEKQVFGYRMPGTVPLSCTIMPMPCRSASCMDTGCHGLPR